MTDVVLIGVSEGVALLTLNRPDRLNAWTPELQTRYFDLLTECADRDDVRAIVVTGAGRGFCAGADMQDLQSLGGNGGPSPERVAAERRPQRLPATIGKPIVAAINGPCAGIGLVQALMCDVRFAAATDAADRLMLASFAGPDFGEGVASFVERREPHFAPLAAEAASVG